MFKSIFTKYVSAFMLIILVSFIVVLALSSSVIGRYSIDTKADIVKTAALLSQEYLNSIIHVEQNADIKTVIEQNSADIKNMIDVIASRTDDLCVVISDNEGNVFFVSGSNSEKIKQHENIPSDILSELWATGEYFSTGKSEGIFKSMKLLHAYEITDGNGNACGAVYVASDSIMMSELLTVVLRVLMGSILWVLLAALIAVYFISERVIAPLREISYAAKKFASGKFDVRVPVRGSDEVAELATAFNNMAESLDNYDNMRNTFMSNVSHDLRSPMTSISGFIDGILDGVIPPEQHKYYLQVVSSEIKRLSRLVASLLDLSRIQAGERKFTDSTFDICEMARQILISFEQKITAKDLDVSFDTESERMNAVADRDAIYQVLYNLCDNAVKFSSEKGELRISIKRIKGKKLLVEVYNEGTGIAPSDINYVFDRFYKSDKSRGLNKSGVGLGLFISKTIIEAHDEKIWVNSEHGKNCCFSFTLEGE